tara:strand:+ start:130 stop:324 length:195 start_codon:yes stop_codon:yes gene_type:complete
MSKQFNERYDILVEYSVATEDEIRLVCCINGRSEETLEDILYVKAGYRDFNLFIENDEFNIDEI